MAGQHLNQQASSLRVISWDAIDGYTHRHAQHLRFSLTYGHDECVFTPSTHTHTRTSTRS
jgi:hypothetical protein